jgi:hypothetical protein
LKIIVRNKLIQDNIPNRLDFSQNEIINPERMIKNFLINDLPNQRGKYMEIMNREIFVENKENQSGEH